MFACVGLRRKGLSRGYSVQVKKRAWPEQKETKHAKKEVPPTNSSAQCDRDDGRQRCQSQVASGDTWETQQPPVTWYQESLSGARAGVPSRLSLVRRCFLTPDVRFIHKLLSRDSSAGARSSGPATAAPIQPKQIHFTHAGCQLSQRQVPEKKKTNFTVKETVKLCLKPVLQ